MILFLLGAVVSQAADRLQFSEPTVQGLTLTTVPVLHPAFAEVTRLEPNANKAVYVDYKLDSTRGFRLLVALWARAVESNTEVSLKIMQGGELLIERTLELEATSWTPLRLITPLDLASRETLSLRITLPKGTSSEAIELAGIQAFGLPHAMSEKETMQLVSPEGIHFNFYEDFKTPENDPLALPEGMLTYGELEENTRFDHLSREGEQGALFVESPKVSLARLSGIRLPSMILSPDYFIKVSSRLRSVTGSSPKIFLLDESLVAAGQIPNLEDPNDPVIVWQSLLRAWPEWNLSEVVVPPSSPVRRVVPVLAMETAGSIEIDRLELNYVSLEQSPIAQALEGNLLYSSSFPLGIVAPWGIADNHYSASLYGASTEFPGPTGMPALRMETALLEGQHRTRINSIFRGKPGEWHTASVWARADREGMLLALRMGPPNEQLHRAPWMEEFELTQDWQRYSLSNQMPFDASGAYLLEILSDKTEGVIWIDGVMVEQGQQISEFQRTERVELALNPTQYQGLFFDTEPMEVDLAYFGERKLVSRIALSLNGIDGKTYPLPEITPEVDEEGQFSKIRIRIPDAGQPHFGSFSLEAVALDEEGNRLSKPAETLLHIVREPRFLNQRAPESRFGIKGNLRPEQIPLLKRMGANWIGHGLPMEWSKLELEPGVWDWETLDSLINTAGESQLEVLGFLVAPPEWASVAEETWLNPWTRRNAVPREEHYGSWKHYTSQMFKRYGDRIRYWEVWPTYFFPNFFVQDQVNGKPVHASTELFIKLARLTAEAARESSFPISLLWNAGFNYESAVDYSRKTLQEGVMDIFDTVSYHQFSSEWNGHPGNELQRGAQRVRQELEDAQLEKKPELWLTETGAGPYDVFNPYRHFPLTETAESPTEQTNRFLRLMLSNLALDTEKIFIYGFFETASWNPHFSYNSLDGSLSHIAVAYSNLAWHLDGKTFKGESEIPNGGTAYFWKGEREGVAVVIGSKETHIRIPFPIAGVDVRDMFGNSVSFPLTIKDEPLYFVGEAIDKAFLKRGLSPDELDMGL